MSTIKNSVLRMEEYPIPPQQCRVKLNQNECGEDIPSDLKEKIIRKISTVPWNRYPAGHPTDLLCRIGDYAGFETEGIIVGNGSNELIQTILCACSQPGGCVAFLDPGFSVYGRAASVMGIDTISVPLTRDFRLDVEAVMKKAIHADVIFIDSPNNPTGSVASDHDVRRIAEAVEGWVVVDEAYFEFSGKTVLPLQKEYENIIILRTFSKALSIAGLRLGYLLASPSVVYQMKKVQLPFSVGSIQQAAGSIMIAAKEWIHSRVSEVIRERDQLFQKMKSIGGIHPFPSSANFILFASLKMPARALWEGLLKRGILIRRFDSIRLENMLRVSVGSPGENLMFLRALIDLTKGDSD